MAGALAAVLLAACNPYDGFDGEFYAGTADPGDYQKQYKGSDTYTAATVLAGGQETQFFFFTPAADRDPTDLSSAPSTYVFDSDAQAGAPFPATPKCKAPKDYVFDLQRDAYRFDDQGNIFTALPDDPSYAPVVAQVPVTSGGEDCQSIKSEKTLTGGARGVAVPVDGDGNGMPDGNYLAWAIVDVASDFEPHDVNFFGPSEHFGWYNHFLIAYVDGGYIPSTSTPDGKPVAVTQVLYVPHHLDADGNDSTEPGSGADIVEHGRGQTGYSPICEIKTFTVNDPNDPPKSAADVMTKGTLDPDPMMPTYVYCLGVQP
jgi:hypothetical protein